MPKRTIPAKIKFMEGEIKVMIVPRTAIDIDKIKVDLLPQLSLSMKVPKLSKAPMKKACL